MSDDIVREFLVESSENLDTLDRELVLLEKDPQNAGILGSGFRTIHTIKGTCGFLGFTRLEKVAHAGENLLSNLRDGKLALNTEIASGLLSMVDAVRHMLAEIESTGQDGEADYRELIENLTRLQQGGGGAGKATARTVPPESCAPPAPAPKVPDVAEAPDSGSKASAAEAPPAAPRPTAAAAAEEAASREPNPGREGSGRDRKRTRKAHACARPAAEPFAWTSGCSTS